MHDYYDVYIVEALNTSNRIAQYKHTSQFSCMSIRIHLGFYVIFSNIWDLDFILIQACHLGIQ